MIHKVSISTEGKPDVIRRLKRIAPTKPDQYDDQHRFSALLDAADPKLQRVLDVLHGAGLRQWQGKADRNFGSEYVRNDRAEWEESDFAACELIQFWPAAHVQSERRDGRGRMQVAVEEMKWLAPIAAGWVARWPCVPERSRKLLAAERFARVGFRPMALRDRPRVGREPVPGGTWGPVPWGDRERWYEITTDAVLPPLAPGVPLGDRGGNPLARRDDFSRGLQILSPRTEPPLRYRGRDLRGLLGTCDVARTREVFVPPDQLPDCWWYVCSPRFREFCLTRKWKVDWTPVVIE